MPVSNKPELLAPAGGMDSVYAAVRCGADAVYLGAKSFSARCSAHNFNDAELAEAVRYCHLHGVQVHQAVNTLVFDEELADAEACIRTAAVCGVDALIIQDLGVAQLAKEICPDIPLHASTQMTVHTADGVRMMEKLGFSRVVLSRELSLEEIRAIREQTSLELEVFVHGALCMSMSGQCYFSAMLGSRSGNRGMCAQPCRLPFSADRTSANALSLKDLCAAQTIAALAEIGVDSFKIEGRMKRPEYVAAAVSAYRRAIDTHTTETDQLRAVFSRSGFTNGYLENRRDAEMFGIRKKEDVTAAAGVLKSLQNLYDKEVAHIPLDLRFVFKENKPMRLTASDGTHTVTATGEPPEQALHVALSEERIRDALGKWGGTPYFAETITLDRDDTVTASIAAINALRRDCAEQLSALRGKSISYAVHESQPITRHPMQGEKALWGRFASLEALTDYAKQNLTKLILPIDLLLESEFPKQLQNKLIAELPRALFCGESVLYERLCALKERGITAVLAGNIASVYTAQKAGMEVHGGFSLNAANARSMDVLNRLGLKSALCSPELTTAQLQQMSAPLSLGAFAYGRLPLMLTRNCPVRAQKACADCKRKSVLYDRKGIAFPIVCGNAYTEVLNSKPIYMADRLGELPALDHLLLYFTDETDPDAVIRAYRSGLRPTEGSYTRGMFYRGVL